MDKKGIKVNIMMEQTFENGEKDYIIPEADVVADILCKQDKLCVVFEGRKMTFEVGKTHEYRYPVGGGEILLFIETLELRQDGNKFDVTYKISDPNGGLISNNKLKMELKI